jgi:hypothetical protein
VATMSAALALLFAELGSVVEEFTVAVSTIEVPAAVPAFTFTFKVKLAVVSARLGVVQRMGPVAPTAGVRQDQPAGNVIDWNVVLGGVLSVKVTPDAALGPALVIAWAYVILAPANTGIGLAEFVIDRFAESATWSVAVAVLLPEFGSLVVLATEAVSVMVEPDATVVFTFTTNVKFAVAVAANVGMVHV